MLKQGDGIDQNDEIGYDYIFVAMNLSKRKELNNYVIMLQNGDDVIQNIERANQIIELIINYA